MFLLSAELFPGHSQMHSPEMFRGIVSGCADFFREMVKWVFVAKQNADVVIISDGRSEVARKQIRDLLSNLTNGDFMELWVVYDLETSLHQDVRNPKRKVAWSGANMEILFVLLQKKPKGNRSLVARDLFTKVGRVYEFLSELQWRPFSKFV